MTALAPVRFLRYVESRRLHLPKVLSQHALQLQYAPISLGGLQTRWKTQVEDERFWLKNKLVGLRPTCSRWFPDFDDTMVAHVQVASDPADAYSTDTDGSSKRLLITFNEAAVNEIGDRLNHDIKQAKTTGAPFEALWALRSLTVSIVNDSPFANIISVFQPLAPIDGAHFQTEANGMTLCLDELWPVFFVMLTDLRAYATREDTEGVYRKAKEEEVWSDLYYPFHIPPTIQRMGRPNFDPSWEYSVHLLAFLSDDPDRMTAWKAALGTELRMTGSTGGEQVSVGWAMTVWEVPTPLPEGEVIDRTLRVGLHSDTYKLLSYFNKLASTILEAIHLHHAEFSPEELRRVVYQYHALKQRIAERKRWLDEFEVRHFRTLNELNDLEDELTSAQYLGDLVIKAAEGLETKADQRYERKIQGIAIFFTVLTLAALGMDGYNFVQGSANEPATSMVERWLFITRLGLVLFSVIVLLILAIRGIPSWLWRRRKHRESERFLPVEKREPVPMAKRIAQCVVRVCTKA